MNQAAIHELKAQTQEYFSLLLMLRSHEDYRDELADELRRVNAEIEDIDAKLLTRMRNIGTALLKL